MVYTAFAPSFTTPQTVDVASVATHYQRLSTDDKLAFLWFAYTEIGRSITPAAPGAARLQLTEGLLNQVKAMTLDEQMTFMRYLVNKVRTPLTRAYGAFTANTKLGFWYQLAELMDAGLVIPVPANYPMSRDARQVLTELQSLDFSQQITVLRKAATEMGVDPLA